MTGPRPLPETIPVGYSVAEIARALSVSARSIYYEIERGAIPVVLIGSGPAARQVQEAVRALWVEEAAPGRWVRR